MQLPGSTPRTVEDLVPDVVDALQGRTDVSTLIPRWMKRAVQDLTASTPFEELRRTGPQVSVSQAINPVANFMNNDGDLSFVEVFTLFVDPPGNTVKDTLDYKTPKAIEIITSPVTTGIPKYWTRFGQNFLVAPVPNIAYTMFIRYQVKHPFPEATDQQSLLGAFIYLPEDWEEILVYATALRVAVAKRWNDQVAFLKQHLYGDPEYMISDGKRGRPGVLSAKLLQVERDQQFNTRQLGIRVPRYGSR